MLPSPERATHQAAWTLVVVLLLLQLGASTLGAFRADDWINLERGRVALTPGGWAEVWTTLNPFGLYRPLVDLWHGAWLRVFGLHAQPMMALLVVLLLAQSLLLARLVREHGGDRAMAALAAAAVWAQPNTHAWTTLWVSNATGALMVAFALAALVLHARAVRRLARGEGASLTLAAMALCLVFGALCKEEIVLLPGIALALEWARAPWVSPAQRRASFAATGALIAMAAVYALFRVEVVPTPQTGQSRYHLRAGVHVLRNAAFFALHLGALPALALLLARWRYPAAFDWPLWRTPEMRRPLRAMAAGLAWAAVALLLYLPISGRPAYGYLLAPSFGIAWAVAHGLAGAARLQARAGTAADPARLLLAHAVLAVALTAGGLGAVQWHRYGAMQSEIVGLLRQDLARHPQGTRVVFVDAGRGETPTGRTLFNLVFSASPGSMLRVALGRGDLLGEVVERPGASSAPDLARPGTVVYIAHGGHIQRDGAPAKPPAIATP
jgi:hypothetical protein